MTFEEFQRALAGMADEETSANYLRPFRLNAETGEQDPRYMSKRYTDQYQPWYETFTGSKDTQGRQSYGSDPFVQGSFGTSFQDAAGVSRYRNGTERLTDQHRAVGGKDSDVTYDAKYGYSIPMALQDKWARQFQKSGMLEKLFNNGPLIMSALVGGMAAAGAGAAGSGAAAGSAGGASLSSLGLDALTMGGYGGAAGGAAGAAGGAISGLSAADILGLQQMGQAAGLSGAALESFVASAGALGSTAAGGGGIGALSGGGGMDIFGALDNWDLMGNTLTDVQLGLDPTTIGEAVQPWTTNPSLADLGGLTMPGGGGGLSDIIKNLQKIPGLGKLFGGDGKNGVLSGLLGKALGGGGIGPLELALLAAGLKESRKNDPSVTTTSSPGWYQQASQDLLAKANAITPGGEWRSYFDKANAANAAANTTLPEMNLNSYMNPYLDSVLTPMKREADLAKVGALQNVDSNAAKMNAFGRNRHDLVKNMTAESADRNWNTTEANLRSGAFTNAQTAALGDLNRKAALGQSYANMGNSVGALSQNDALLPIVAGSTALKSITPDRTITQINPPPSLFGQAAGALGALSSLSNLR